MPAKTAIACALGSLTDPGSLRKGHQGDPSLRSLRSNLMHEEVHKNDRDERLHDDYFLDDYDLVYHAPLGWGPVLAVHQSLVPDLMSLIHALHVHPGVASTLALIRERFHCPSIARDAREYVRSCGCRTRRKSASQKVAML